MITDSAPYQGYVDSTEGYIVESDASSSNLYDFPSYFETDEGKKHLLELQTAGKNLTNITIDKGHYFCLKDAEILTQLLKNNSQIKTFIIDNSLLEDKGITELAKIFINNPKLEYLGLASSCFTKIGMKLLAESLKNTHTLKYLDLSHTCAGMNKDITPLIEILSNNTNLRALCLNQAIEERHIKILAKTLKTHHKLETLIINDCKIGSYEEDIHAFVETLKNLPNLKTLDLDNTYIDDKNLELIIIALQNNLYPVKLHLRHCSITEVSLENFARVLTFNEKPNIQWLSLAYLYYSTQKDTVGIFAQALKFNKTLQGLNLRGVFISSQLKQLIEALKYNSTLYSLNIANCTLYDDTIDTLIDVLTFHNYSLTEIKTTSEPISEKIILINNLINRNRELRDQLFLAIERDDIYSFEKMIDQKISLLSISTEFGNTPLHTAVYKKRIKMISRLIQVMHEQQIPLNTPNNRGLTAEELTNDSQILALFSSNNSINILQNTNNNTANNTNKFTNYLTATLNTLYTFSSYFLPITTAPENAATKPVENQNPNHTQPPSLTPDKIKNSPIKQSSLPIDAQGQSANNNNNDLTTLTISLNIPYNELKIEKILGAGAFGKVFKGTWQYTNVAIKQLMANSISTAAQDDFFREITVMANLRHPNIVSLYGASINIKNQSAEYCIVMEYMPNSSLHWTLHRKKVELDFDTRVQIAINIGKGLAYLHNRKIIHSDLKSSNVLLTEKYEAKLCDFGLARMHDIGGTKLPSPTALGTAGWMAPELDQSDAKCSEFTDMYSFGVVLWELISRCEPIPQGFISDSTNSLSTNTTTTSRSAQAKTIIPDNCPKKLAHLIEWCWNPKSTERPTAVQALEYFDSLEKERDTFGVNHTSVNTLPRLRKQ